MRSLLVPREETAFYVFEADDPDVVERVLREAGLEAERISVAIPANDRTRSTTKPPLTQTTAATTRDCGSRSST